MMRVPAFIGLTVVVCSARDFRPFLSVLPFLAIVSPMSAGN